MATAAGSGFCMIISTMFLLLNMCISENTTETGPSVPFGTIYSTQISEDSSSATRNYDYAKTSGSADTDPCFFAAFATVRVKTNCNMSVIEPGAFAAFPDKDQIVRIYHHGFIELFAVG